MQTIGVLDLWLACVYKPSRVYPTLLFGDRLHSSKFANKFLFIRRSNIIGSDSKALVAGRRLARNRQFKR